PTIKARSPLMLIWIGLFKLIKAGSLITLGILAINLLHKDVAATINGWIEDLHLDPDNRIVQGLLTPILAISPKELKATSVITFLYAALLLTEGVGLLLRKRWGEYLTIVATSLLLVPELYELSLGVTAAKLWV